MSSTTPAISVVRNSTRFDLGFKLAYAQSKLFDSWKHESAKRYYLESIQAFNGFFEEEPEKVGPADFLTSFDRLILDISSNGYRSNCAPIPVNQRGDPVDGAHRLAISSLLGLAVPVQESSEAANYDHDFFVQQGLDEMSQFVGLTQLLTSNPSLRWIIVHSVVPADLNQRISKIIERSGKVFFSFDRWLTDVGAFNLKRINYSVDEDGRRPEWIGAEASGYHGLLEHAALSSGQAPTRFFLFQASAGASLRRVKEELRAQHKSGNYGFHSTDTLEETIRVAQTFFHPATFNHFNEIEFPSHQVVNRQLNQLTGYVNSVGISRDTFCVGGSFPMAILGLRQAHDIDIITPGEFESQWSNAPEGIGVHSLSDAPYHLSAEVLCSFPTEHFFFDGFKFVSLENVARMKRERREDKDLIDLSLISSRTTTIAGLPPLDLERAKKRVKAHQRRLRLRRIAARIPFSRAIYRKTLRSARATREAGGP